ncbi:MAG: low affinity iron permease family protein [Pseudolabrys sp.]|nr:low affinity iron permease family protein [Pseudolabrys sp.]
MIKHTTKNGDGHSSGDGVKPLTSAFSTFAQRTAAWTGHPTAFLLAVAVIIVWVVTGPIFNYSDTWQLIINTGTTVVTFLMVFLIQNTQNRDMLSMQLKLSELVLAMHGAKNKFASVEDLSDEELEALHQDCRARAEMTLDSLEKRREKVGKRTAAHKAKAARKPAKA